MGCHGYSSTMASFELGKPRLFMHALSTHVNALSTHVNAQLFFQSRHLSCPQWAKAFSILGEGKTHVNCSRCWVCPQRFSSGW